MKLLKFSFLLVLVSFFAACGEDDSSNECIQSDWVGVYVGTVVCDGNSEDATITVTANGSDRLDINYVSTTIVGSYTGVTYGLCDIDEETIINGETTAITGTLDGDDFSMTDVSSGGSNPGTCVISGSK